MFSFIGTKKDASIVRVGCQPSRNGTLLDDVYLLNKPDQDHTENYCATTMTMIDNEQNCTQGFGVRSDTGDNTCSTDIHYSSFTVKGENAQNDLIQCTMKDCGDVCDGCDIEFYHNTIDRDEIFNPTQSEPVVRFNQNL